MRAKRFLPFFGLQVAVSMLLVNNGHETAGTVVAGVALVVLGFLAIIDRRSR